MMVRYLARIRFRKRKKVEHAAATKVQALMRGAWGRKHAQVSKVMLEKRSVSFLVLFPFAFLKS
jgi:hypothetical protein